MTLKKILTLKIASLLLVSCTTINPGYEGTFSYLSGYDSENTYQSGTYLKAPWTEMIKYNMRQRQDMQSMSVLDKNGLDVKLEVSVLFKIRKGKSGNIHENLGQNFEQTFVIPQMRSVSRQIVSRYTAEQLYASRRDSLQMQMFKLLKYKFDAQNLNLEEVLIRDVDLPKKLAEAISDKQEKEQESLRMDYVLEIQRKESERKLIEARAQAQANEIIQASLSEKILQAQGIEATLKLSESSNSKIIVIGGKDGLPLLLNN